MKLNRICNGIPVDVKESGSNSMKSNCIKKAEQLFQAAEI